MTNHKYISVRNYHTDDAAALAAIYYNTIHNINSKDYSPEQINAWAPESSLRAEEWINKWRLIPPIVATLDRQVVGFVEFEENGHIDCFYCHHEYQGLGVGSALINEVEKRAREKQINRIFAEVSITAKPFFEKKGLNVVKEQLITLRGITLTNYLMEKILT